MRMRNSVNIVTFFEVLENRKAVRDTYGLQLFRPNLIVVMGKRGDYFANDLRKVESDIPNLTIITYDDPLERGRSWIRKV
jgi:hypothetical protein